MNQSMEQNSSISLSEFKAAATELLPVIQELQALLNKHGLGNGTLYFGSDGYFNLSGGSFNGWELVQYSGDAAPYIKYKFSTQMQITKESADAC